MLGWLLLLSRDTGLLRELRRVLVRVGRGCQLWAVASPQLARRTLARHESLPAAIILDELFLSGDALEDVAEEFSWYAPVVAVGHAGRQSRMAPLVAEGKADFLLRGNNFIPLAVAMVERVLRRQRELDEQSRFCAAESAESFQTNATYDPEGFPAEALRLLGAILDNLELVLADRRRLPAAAARCLGRAADLAFDLKSGLRLLVGPAESVAEPEAFRPS